MVCTNCWQWSTKYQMKLTMYGNKQCEREIFQISEQQVVPPDSFEVRDMTELIPTSRADSNGRGIVSAQCKF